MNERNHDEMENERGEYIGARDWYEEVFRKSLRAIATHMRDDSLLDERAYAYLLFLIETGQGECRYDERPGVSPHGVVWYRGAWHDTPVFCRMAGEDGASDRDPHPFGGRRW